MLAVSAALVLYFTATRDQGCCRIIAHPPDIYFNTRGGNTQDRATRALYLCKSENTKQSELRFCAVVGSGASQLRFERTT
jgi:hypothetical protein